MTSSIYTKRIKRCFNDLKQRRGSSVLLLSSNPPTVRSHDTYHQYMQHSDFYYLTGTQIQDAALILSSNKKKPTLMVHAPDPVKILWEGKQPSAKSLAKELDAELVVVKNMRAEAKQATKGHAELIFQNTPSSLSYEIAREIIATPSHARGTLPSLYAHSDSVLEKMRLYKDAAEVEAIKDANAVTTEALLFVAAKLRPGQYEFEVARTLEYIFGMNSASVAFNSIVGSGANAATLHYESLAAKIKNDDMVLIDCGAQLNRYCADITRVLPASGMFTPIHRIVYEIVLQAQLAALKKVKAGVKILSIYDAAAEVITEGLKELGVLKGPLKSLMKNKAFKPYFPHGIGHSLGLDVHDLSQLRGNNEAVLEAGMVFTIEPGLYFSKAIKNVPACGVRIEDNVLVTKSGCEILSPGFPKDAEQIEALMQSYAAE